MIKDELKTNNKNDLPKPQTALINSKSEPIIREMSASDKFRWLLTAKFEYKVAVCYRCRVEREE
jgi:hypothetical protein